MKKITIITMQLKTPGGIERFVSTLATVFAEDYEVEIISNYGRPSDELAFPIPNNIKLTFLTKSQPREVSLKTIITSLKWHQILPELKRRRCINRTQNHVFQKYLTNLDTNFIITDRALYSSLVNRYYHGNAKKIATDHNYHQNNKKYISTLLKSIRSFDYLVVATKELRDFYQPLTSVKCVYIPNPIPTIPTKKSPLSTKNIISVGRLVPEKDYSLLIDAMRCVHSQDPTIHLTIIGDGKEYSHLQNQINTLNLSGAITLTGWLPQEKIADYYYDSSLFVMTSKTEAFGLVLTEAMSYGLPCIALKRASGARAQISKTTGLLLNTDNPEKIASAIVKTLQNPTALHEYQSSINHTITNYSADSVKKQWRTLLQTTNQIDII